MTSNYKRLLLLFSLMALLTVQSCDDDDERKIPGEDGFFIVNEGAFGNGNASISFYDRQTDAVTNDLFAVVNGRPLGDQAQSMTVYNDKGYIVIQNSGKIEVIDDDDYTSVATISEDIESPRYFIGISTTKGYVSDWGTDGLTGTVKVINLSTNEVTKTISTGQGANRMVLVANEVYVTNSGGFGYDNTVKIIDTNTDAVTGSITVGDNPNSLVLDAAGNLWVASSGSVAYNTDWSIDEENSTPGSLSKINTSNTEVLRLEVGEITYGGIGNLSSSPDGTILYYTFNGSVYKMATSATALPTTAFKEKNYYGLAVNPFNGTIIGCAAPNFSSSGSIDVMDEDGTIVDTYTVGIAPNGCAFK